MTNEISSERMQSSRATAANNANHLRQKRARSQLSCIPCRTGKLKCNRAHDPACDQCIKRNRETACTWVPPPLKRKDTRNVNGRIQQLESLVVDLMNQQQQNGGNRGQQETREASSGQDAGLTPPSSNEAESPELDSEVEAPTKSFGQLRIGKNEISYVGESHWHAILNGISDLRRHLEEEEEEEEQEEEQAQDTRPFGTEASDDVFDPTNALRSGVGSTGMGFMLGNPPRMTKEQLIAAVPDKKVADRLLSLWFNSPDPFKPIIHGPTFQDEYRQFWRDPKQTPTMWLGVLFSIISLAVSFGLRDSDPSSPAARATLADVNKYHSLAASAAVLAEFASPKRYTIECLVLYAAGLRSNNALVNVWLMAGLITRLALRMGYHRDPDNYPAISAFDGEMRRRCWASIGMIDVLISFQLGLPSMVRTIVADTKPPSNLLDRDFNPSTSILPPSRGVDELTPCSYVRSKLKLVAVFSEAAELSHATIRPSHEQIMALDRQLDEAIAALPPLLRMPDISELVTDPAEQLMCRFNLDLLALKTRIVLHRRYMDTPFAQLTPFEQERGLGLNRQKAVEAAVKVLNHHHTIYAATQPGGQLENVKWYMGSISTHDFLLAAMVVCLELSQHIGANAEIMNKPGTRCSFRDPMMEALEKSHDIWAKSSRKRRSSKQVHGRGHVFDETETASRAMAAMLKKLKGTLVQEGTVELTIQPGDTAEPIAVSHSTGTTDGTSSYQSFEPNMGPSTTTTGAPFYNGILGSNADWNSPPPPLDFTMPPLQASVSSSFNPAPSTNLSSMHHNSISPPIDPSLTGYPNLQPSTTNMDLTPEVEMDFDMINAMLSMPSNLDWDMFDQGVINAASAGPMDPVTTRLQSGSGNASTTGQAFSAGGFDYFPIAAGNAMVGGGTGPGSGWVYPGGGWTMGPEMGMDGMNGQ